jgi:4-amino-4-deoxy-L-arabinose transferase-like glycosyltransferase
VIRGRPAGSGAGFPGRTTGAGGIGSLLDGSTPGSAVVKLLERDASSYTWVASAVGSNTAAGYQLATGDPVMAIGGFNGTDPAPTLAEFKRFVSEHKIHYFVSGGVVGGAGGTGSSDASSIATLVADHFTSTTVDGVTVYDLTAHAR